MESDYCEVPVEDTARSPEMKKSFIKNDTNKIDEGPVEDF